MEKFRDDEECAPVVLYADQDNEIPVRLVDRETGDPVKLTVASGMTGISAYFPTPDGNLVLTLGGGAISIVDDEAGRILVTVTAANMALLNLKTKVKQDWKVVVTRNVAPLQKAARFPKRLILEPALVPAVL